MDTKNAQQPQPNLLTVTQASMTWTYIELPTRLEMDALAERYPFFHPLNLDDCISRIQTPKIDEYDDHLFLVLHFPKYDKQANLSLPSEVDVFIGKDFVVTVHCLANLKPLANLFHECQTDAQSRSKYLGKGPAYLLYQIIDRLVDSMFPMLDKINNKIESLQEAVISNPVPETVKGILMVRRDIISLRRIIHLQVELVDEMERKLRSREYPFLDPKRSVYFGDIGDHLHKINNVVQDQKEVVEALTDTSNWLTSHHIQEIMRVLTVFMAVIMPLGVVAGLTGSNAFPHKLINNTYVFVGEVAVEIMLALGMLYFFHRKRFM
jgi:magnesium transporter